MVGEPEDLAHVFEGTGVIFGGEEVVAIFELEAFANVFEGVSHGPADADGLLGEGEGLFALGVNGALGLYPRELVGH
jgi:hypothetical protein